MKIKKALIISRVDHSDPSNIGVINKYQQIRTSLKNLNIEVDSVAHSKTSILLNHVEIESHVPLHNASIFKWTFFKNLQRVVDIKSYGFLLVRYGLSTPSFIDFLRWSKKENQKLKVVIEMPTYPYADEWQGFQGRAIMLIDSLYRRNLKKCVDLILHSGQDPTIFGIPTFKMSNGISTSSYPLTQIFDVPDKLRLIGVAKWQKWHGVDRILKGLSSYRDQMDKRDISLHLVGHGPYSSHIKKLIQNLDLKQYVVLHESLYGDKLNDLYAKSHLAIGTLGLHTKGVEINSSLKHREYCARGIPFVLSSLDSDFPEALSFVKYVESSDDPVDITDIVKFYESLNVATVSREMRHYAETFLSWDERLKALINLLEKRQ